MNGCDVLYYEYVDNGYDNYKENNDCNNNNEYKNKNDNDVNNSDNDNTFLTLFTCTSINMKYVSSANST